MTHSSSREWGRQGRQPHWFLLCPGRRAGASLTGRGALPLGVVWKLPLPLTEVRRDRLAGREGEYQAQSQACSQGCGLGLLLEGTAQGGLDTLRSPSCSPRSLHRTLSSQGQDVVGRVLPPCQPSRPPTLPTSVPSVLRVFRHFPSTSKSKHQPSRHLSSSGG